MAAHRRHSVKVSVQPERDCADPTVQGDRATRLNKERTDVTVDIRAGSLERRRILVATVAGTSSCGGSTS